MKEVNIEIKDASHHCGDWCCYIDLYEVYVDWDLVCSIDDWVDIESTIEIVKNILSKVWFDCNFK